MNTQDMALLLAEGETAKAQSITDYLNMRADRDQDQSRNVLWRLRFAHITAAEHYIARAKQAIERAKPEQMALIDECDLIKAVLNGYPPSIARTDALRATDAIRLFPRNES